MMPAVSLRSVEVPLEVGSRIAGQYELVHRISVTNISEVWRCVDRRGATVVVKVLRAEISSNAAFWFSAFEREIAALMRCNHPNIVSIYDAGYLPSGRPYYVMEYLEGEDLWDFENPVRLAGEHVDCPQGTRMVRLDWETAVWVTIEIAKALEHAHAAKIILRDLKSENVFLVKDGDRVMRVVVLDFGAARVRPLGGDFFRCDTHDPKKTPGTPQFASPEQMQGNEADSRSDLFSLGVILQRLIEGYLPFNVFSELSSPTGVIRLGRKRVRQVVPPAIQTVLDSLLENDPRLRPRALGSYGRRLKTRSVVAPRAGSVSDPILGKSCSLLSLYRVGFFFLLITCGSKAEKGSALTLDRGYEVRYTPEQ